MSPEELYLALKSEFIIALKKILHPVFVKNVKENRPVGMLVTELLDIFDNISDLDQD